jgi:hypothetical protein
VAAAAGGVREGVVWGGEGGDHVNGRVGSPLCSDSREQSQFATDCSI